MGERNGSRVVCSGVMGVVLGSERDRCDDWATPSEEGWTLGSLEGLVLRLPVAGRWYAGRAAWLKRRYCLVMSRLGLLKPYTFVQWLATSVCNFSCPFCEASAGAVGDDELTTDEARAFIDDLETMGVRNLVVSGGEPLMRTDLPELLDHAASRGLRLGLVTNAFLLPGLWPRLEHLPIYLVFTSLDGPEQYHDSHRGVGSYSRVLESLRLVRDAGVSVRMVNTVVQPKNLDLIERLRPILERAGVTHWRLTPMASVGRAQGDGRFLLDGEGLRTTVELAESLRGPLDVDLGESHTYLGCLAGSVVGKPFFCGAGLTRCSVMPDGSVLGCHQAYDTALAEGNVRDRPLSVLWREEFRRFRTTDVPEACRSCDHLGACQGGCWAEWATNGCCARDLWHEGSGEPHLTGRGGV